MKMPHVLMMSGVLLSAAVVPAPAARLAAAPVPLFDFIVGPPGGTYGALQARIASRLPSHSPLTVAPFIRLARPVLARGPVALVLTPQAAVLIPRAQARRGAQAAILPADSERPARVGSVRGVLRELDEIRRESRSGDLSGLVRKLDKIYFGRTVPDAEAPVRVRPSAGRYRIPFDRFTPWKVWGSRGGEIHLAGDFGDWRAHVTSHPDGRLSVSASLTRVAPELTSHRRVPLERLYDLRLSPAQRRLLRRGLREASIPGGDQALADEVIRRIERGGSK